MIVSLIGASMEALVIAPYSKDWPLQFAELHAQLQHAFTPDHAAVEHIGSTSVPGLSAKPIIDVLLGADSLDTIERKIAIFERLGFEYITEYEAAFPTRRYFVRPASSTLRVNLHAVAIGSQFWLEHLAFRNALRSDPLLVSQYQELKVQLAATFAHDRMAYTEAKAPFIRAVVAAALSAAYDVG